MVKLVAVVAQRERPGMAAGQRLETCQVRDPFRVRQAIEPDPGGPAVVTVAQDRLRERRGLHHVEKPLAQGGVGDRRAERHRSRH